MNGYDGVEGLGLALHHTRHHYQQVGPVRSRSGCSSRTGYSHEYSQPSLSFFSPPMTRYMGVCQWPVSASLMA